MNTNRQLIEQFLQFINTGDATIGNDTYQLITSEIIRKATGMRALLGNLSKMCHSQIS